MIKRLTLRTFTQAKRLIQIVIGFTLLIVGVALIFLPGPAVAVIPLGLVTLAGEFVWAKKLLERFSSGVKNLNNIRK